MKISFNCVILFVQDVEKLKHFYIGSLGLEMLEEINGDWVLLGAGACTVGLHKVGPGYEAPAGQGFKAQSNTKLVFDIEHDIFEVREKLISENVLARDLKTFPNYSYWLFDGEDPEGNVFQLRQRKQPGT